MSTVVITDRPRAAGRFQLSPHFRRLLSYFRPYRKALAVGVACGAAMNAIKVVAPFVLRRAIDALALDVTYGALLGFGGLLVAVACAQGLFYFVQRRALNTMSRDIEYDLRNDYYRHLQKLPPLDLHRTHRTGDLMARATNDASAVRVAVGPAVITLLDTFFAAALIIPLMLSISWQLTLLSICSMPVMALSTKFFTKRIHNRFGEVQEHFGRLTNRVQESVAGVRLVRAYGREAGEVESFGRVNRELLKCNQSLTWRAALINPLLQFIVGVTTIALFWYGGVLILSGRLTIGQYVQFKAYLGFLILPVVMFGYVITLFQRGMAAMKRVDAVLATEAAIGDGRAASDAGEIAGEIEFSRLTFNYPGAAEPALKGIDLRAAPGQTIAFVGTVGSGKTTLMNLVARLLDADYGQVLVDGRPIQQIPLGRLRASIGYVQQETFLFGGTIAENIVFGAEGATPEDVRRAAREAGIAEEIEAFPKGFETIVGERGVTLSGGQKQRVAIARALIRRPRILLLDDALSSVDAETEREILAHLRRAARGCTCLLVSHRVPAVRGADLIVVLKDGEVVERGTHAELAAGGGLYASMYERQLIEESLAAD
jgi:ATP-binding cassette subfamily B multidrug efflux pump